MEQTLVNLAKDAAWLFLVIFVFAAIGVVATVRWIIGMVWGAEQAVERGVHSVDDKLHGR
jgi:hypothetical protein